MTKGEQIYFAMQNPQIALEIAIQIKEKKAAKIAKSKISDAKFLEVQKNKPFVEEKVILIADDAAKFQHAKLGTGTFICEDEKTITLQFDGQTKILVKAFNKLIKL